MSDVADRPHLSASEFLAWERLQSTRHQFIDGEIFAMAGGSARHNALTANAIGLLYGALRGNPCRVLSSDQRILLKGEQYVYADVSLVCGPVRLQPGTNDVLENPSVVIEVLSPSTEAYDRGGKWQGYQQLPSLTDYLLVSQQRARVEHFQREAAGVWRYRVAQAGDKIVLTNGVTVAVDELYEGVFELALEE